MPRERYTFAQKRCLGLAGKVIQNTRMIGPGAKVGVAVSGGVDGWVLLKVLQLRRRIVPFRYDIMALHINPGFDSQSHVPLVDWLLQEGIAGHVEISRHGVDAHGPENRKRSACFYCSMLRRKRLFDLCAQYNLTHLAFVHNADDLAATFMMNLIQNGRIYGMALKDGFFGNRLSVIRPLLFVEKNFIIRAAQAWKLPIWKNECPSAGNTKRSDMETELAALYKIHPKAKTNILNALCRWEFNLAAAENNSQYVPDKEEPMP